MTNSRDGSSGLPSDGNNDFIREGPAVASGSGGAEAYAEVLGFDSVGSEVGADRVSGTADRSVEDRCSDPGVVNVEGEVSGLGDASGETLEKALISGEIDNGKKKNDLRIVKTEQKKLKSSVEDYDSMLSEFDHFASKGVGEAVGYGYEIGDMVWGKVKSHPWWPGYIYNEAFASPSVWRAKRNGHVLVAFFGDGSYGWFELAELIPFAENFGEKSRQTTSRSFVKAVEEAVGEFSRRRSLALACRCRNDFNFWPSKVEGYYVVDVGDYEPGVYSLSQINKSREDFEPKEMLSFIDQLALKPRANQHNTIEFIKNKATALATRRAMFEEFDETYAQAFGSTPVRPERPTMPVAVDPAKAPLSGPLVFAETLGKGKVGAKITKIKEQVEDKYIFKRRDESPAMNIKKETMELASSDAPPLLVDGSGLTRMPVDLSTKGQMHHVPLSGINDSQLPGMSRKVSIISDVKPPEGSRKIIQGGIKKVKVKKEHRTEVSAENAALVEKKKRKKAMGAGQPAGELNSASVNLVEKKRKKDMGAEQPAGELSPASINLVEKKKKKKRKKEIGNETSPALPQLPVAISSSGATADKVSGMLVDIPVIVKNELDTHQDVVMSSSSPTIEKQQVLDMRNIEFSMLLRDLHALALNPFHGAERGCPARVQQVFLNFRTLVYQKSLVLFPSVTEKGEAASAALPASAAALRGPTEKTKDKKLVKPPLVRADDPTKGGKKRGPSDRPEVPKKKRLDESIGIDKKKRDDSDGIVKKKKMVGDLKSSSAEKKIAQRPAEMQRENMKAIASKTIPSAGLKGVKLESGKRVELPSARTPNTPTMLTLKFPSGAALPSGAELRAKFTRFGPMDHTATRILWKSYTCRLVFRKKADAEAALKYVNETSKLFGNADVRPFLREVEVDAPEPEPVKVQRNDSSIEPPRTTSRVPTSHQQQQLKSCLKKPVSGEEGGYGNGNGNGISNGNGNNNGRGTRVKFVLGGEGSNTAKAEQVSSSSIAATATASSSSYADKLDVSSKNLPKLIPESIGATTTTTTASTSSNPLPPPTHHLHPPHQFQRFPSNMLPPVSSGAVGEPPSSSSSSSSSSSRQMPRPPNKEDISQQFLNLLTRCSDVVNTLSGALGYVPYHSL